MNQRRPMSSGGPRRGLQLWAPILLFLMGLSACFPVLPSSGGGQTEFRPPRQIDASDIELPDGYRATVVASGLDMPTGVAFDDDGYLYVVEAGYSYGELFDEPRLLRVEQNGEITEVASGSNPPWNGVAFWDGSFFVAGGHTEGGEILRVAADGRVETVVEGLPSRGDHHTNGPLPGEDGWLYFGQGTATNSAVVGPDNYEFGWLSRDPGFHDRPCRDVILSGVDYRSPDPLAGEGGTAVTGAFVPFGTPTESGQVVEGGLPCTGAVLRVRPDGSEMELVAWGLRNPYGLAWDDSGRLLVTENSYDERGSRPVFGTGDLLWEIEPDSRRWQSEQADASEDSLDRQAGRAEAPWLGWPDFWAGRPLNDEEWFSPVGGDAPRLLLAQHPQVPPEPLAILGVHSSSNGLDVSRTEEFGFVGDAFIAQFGDMAPGVGKVLEPVGFKVVRVDSQGRVFDFARNRGERNGPGSRLGTGGLERPVSVRFGPDGALYVVDFGVMTITNEPQPRLGTGIIWRIERDGER